MLLIRDHKAALPVENFRQLCASTGMLCWLIFSKSSSTVKQALAFESQSKTEVNIQQ